MSAKVFIGMPVYNGSRFIGEALNALLTQDFTDWELLISDDASSDDTLEIIKKYAAQDSRIRYVHQEKNLGLFDNFKYTLEQAHSTYFMWAAQDDLWENNFLSVCVAALENNSSLGLACSVINEIDSQGITLRTLTTLTKLSNKPSIASIAHYISEPEILGRCNIMYGLWKTDILRIVWQAYPQRKTWGQDYIFVLAGIARTSVYIDHQHLFKKRLGGYSSPNALDVKTEQRIFKNPKNFMVPLGRFIPYYKGHLQALTGTPYKLIAIVVLIARLPRIVFNSLKSKLA